MWLKADKTILHKFFKKYYLVLCGYRFLANSSSQKRYKIVS